MRDKTFKKDSIISAFRKTGIVPFHPELVINRIKTFEVDPIDIALEQDVQDDDFDPEKTPKGFKELNRLGSYIDDMINNDTYPTIRTLQAYRKADEAKLHYGHLAQQTLRRNQQLAREKAKTTKSSNYVLQNGGQITL
jgi:hypothetical protein